MENDYEPNLDGWERIYARRNAREVVAAVLDKYFDGVDQWASPSMYDVIEGKWYIKREIVAEQIGILAGNFPYGQPHSADVYIRTLIEEIIAAKAHPAVLESACRWW